MGLALSILFFAIGGLIILLCVILILQIGFVRLESRIGRARDGYPPGKAVPTWSLPDLTGQIRKSPSRDRWQLLIFANYTIGGFPELISNIRQLALTSTELEIIILADAREDFCEAMVRGLELSIPVVSVDQNFYQSFRVRTMPFAFFVDPDGKIHWVGMAGTKALLTHVWQLLESVKLAIL